jgi:hypothetical protein
MTKRFRALGTQAIYFPAGLRSQQKVTQQKTQAGLVLGALYSWTELDQIRKGSAGKIALKNWLLG